MGTAENAVTRAVVDLLTTSGWLVVRTQAGTAHGGRMRLGPEGWPDLTCFGPKGRVLLIEVKRWGGKVRPAQAVMGAKLMSMGHAVWFCDSVDDAMYILNKNTTRSTLDEEHPE